MKPKFSKHFNDYSVTTPMWKLSNNLFDESLRPKISNPLYYYNHCQYLNSGFFRAVLGLETVWDKEKEAKLNKELDYVLSRAEKRLEHELAVYEIINPVTVAGVLWLGGIFPEDSLKGFSPRTSATGVMKLKAKERVTVRKLDDDEWYRVDVENSSGRVLTIHPQFWKEVEIFNARRIIDSQPFRRRMSSLFKDPKRTRVRKGSKALQKMPKRV